MTLTRIKCILIVIHYPDVIKACRKLAWQKAGKTLPHFFFVTTQTWSLKRKSNDFQSYLRRETAGSYRVVASFTPKTHLRTWEIGSRIFLKDMLFLVKAICSVVTLLCMCWFVPVWLLFINNDDVYRVEKILRKRKRKGIVEYFVKWKGYPDKFNSWIAESNISKLWHFVWSQ